MQRRLKQPSLLSYVIGLFVLIGPVFCVHGQGYLHNSKFPSANDDLRAVARRVEREADELRREWRARSLHVALKKYEQAANFYARLDDQERRAEMLALMGEVNCILSRHETAIDYFEKALQFRRKQADERGQVDLLNEICDAYLEMAKPKEAIPYSRQAHEISSRINYPRGMGRSLNSLGLISSMTGDVFEAQNLFNKALSIWQKDDYPKGHAYALLNLGYLNGNLGNTQQSLSFYEQARVIAQSIDDRRMLAFVLTAMGGHYALTGEKQRALELHDEALALFRAIGDRGGEAVALNGSGFVYDELGKEKSALTRYTRALALFHATNNQRYAAITLGYIGRVYFTIDKQKAFEFHNQKLLISRQLEDPRMESYTLRDIGSVLASLNQKKQAEACYTEALELSRRVGDRRGEAYVRASLGFLHETTGEHEQALEEYQAALALLRGVTDRRGEISTLYSIARIKKGLGRIAEARSDIETSLSLIESLRSKVASPSLRMSFVDTVYQQYEFYLDLLMSLHRADPNAGYSLLAFKVNEHARARTLLENLRASSIDIRQGVDPELLQLETQLQQQLNEKAEQQMRLLSGRYTADQRNALQTQIEELASQFEAVESKVRERSPQYATLTQPAQRAFTDLQRELDEKTLVIEYALGTDRSYAWAVTNNSVNTFLLPKRSEIEAESKVLYETLEKGRSQPAFGQAYSATAARLSSLLLAPMRSVLTRQRIVIVADGILHNIPFAALTEPREDATAPQQPLIVNHEVITLPSLSTLAVLRNQLRDRSRAPKTLAIFADPVFEKSDPRMFAVLRHMSARGNQYQQSEGPTLKQHQLSAARDLGRDNGPVNFVRLPFSAQEADAVLAVVPEGESKRALGFEASLQTALNPDLRDYRIIHFATHGLLNNSHPELSGVVLSLFNHRGERQDGFLRLNEIYNLNLSADLVVLSACQTGLGKQVRGEGLIGLTRGFMYAGVPRVIASLWRIDDRAAAELMRFFYEALLVKHLTPAAALRDAQIKMWQSREWRFPHYWAAFVLQGEWN